MKGCPVFHLNVATVVECRDVPLAHEVGEDFNEINFNHNSCRLSVRPRNWLSLHVLLSSRDSFRWDNKSLPCSKFAQTPPILGEMYNKTTIDHNAFLLSKSPLWSVLFPTWNYTHQLVHLLSLNQFVATDLSICAPGQRSLHYINNHLGLKLLIKLNS
jgi:hypothetical protein